MEVAQLPAYFTWDYLTTLSKKIPLGIYSTWTERLRGEISEKYLFPALVKIRQIPSDFENFSLKEIECKIIQAETSEDLRKARALLGKEKTAVDLLEGFSKDYPNLNRSIHKTKKAVEAFFHTNILDLIKVLKNTYMPLDFLYLSYKLINSPLILHLKQIAERKKAFLNKEQTPTKNYHKYTGTYKKLVGPLDFLIKVYKLGESIFNSLDPKVLAPDKTAEKALFDCTYLVKSWENLDKTLSQKPEEKKHER